MNSTGAKIHLCKFDATSNVTQQIPACESDIIAFCKEAEVLSVKADFAKDCFGDVPKQIRDLTKYDRLGGVTVDAWATCKTISEQSIVDIRLLVEEPYWDGTINKHGTVSVSKSDKCGRIVAEPINTLIDLDAEFATSQQSLNIVSIPVHRMPAHLVFYRKANADKNLAFLVQELSDLCFEHFPKQSVELQKTWGLEREDDQAIVCYFPKDPGFVQFVVSVLEVTWNQPRKIVKKFATEAVVISHQ